MMSEHSGSLEDQGAAVVAPIDIEALASHLKAAERARAPMVGPGEFMVIRCDGHGFSKSV